MSAALRSAANPTAQRSLTSIVIPTFNGARYIERTLDSVARQTVPPTEIVVVDDGSTDDTVEIIRALLPDGARLLTQPNRGATAARNAGVAALRAASAYLLFLDQDDLLEPTMLEELQAHLDAHPEAGAAFCAFSLVDSDGRETTEGLGGWPPRSRAGRWRVEVIPDDEPTTPLLSLLDFVAVMPSLVLLRRAVFSLTPGWDESFVVGGGEDTNLLMEMALRSEVHYLPRRLVRYRMHASQASAHRQRLYEEQRRLHDMWRYLERLAPEHRSKVAAAWQAYDRQLLPGRALSAARREARRGRLVPAGRILGGAARILARSWLDGLRSPELPRRTSRN